MPDDLWELEKITLNVPKSNVKAIDAIAKKMTAGNRTAYINLLIFNAVREAVESGLIDEEQSDEIAEGAR